ncbi:MAG: hypothetical protein KAI29_03860 [Cyclobacteriaceae bacterium]|nr:hypothetical protein [Cyclobacteriaceae bacterium]
MKETIKQFNEIQTLQLSRLERLADVIYALVLWRLFTLIPKPVSAEGAWHSFPEYLGESGSTLVIVVIGVIFTIIYWLQSNTLLGNLEKSDSKHTILSIIHLFALLLFLLSLNLGVVLGGSVFTRLLESITAALTGLSGALAWRYGIRNRRLIQPDVNDFDAQKILDGVLAEPLTALMTIPFAFAGPWMWEASWLLLIPTNIVLKRMRKNRLSK